jgi:hypothetical protein
MSAPEAEQENKGQENLWWFVLGYLAAIAVMYLADYLTERLTDLLATDVVLTSVNGTAETPDDETRVAETIEQGEKERE